MQRTALNKLAIVGVIGTSALLVAGTAVAYLQDQEARALVSEPAATYEPKPMSVKFSTPLEPFTPMREALGRLQETDRPWTMTVLGDSTGDETDEWVYRLTERLAAETGRPATIRTWDLGEKAYQPATTIDGDGAPIIVWNGSAAAQTAAYADANRRAMAPEQSDLVIVSHGLNHRNPSAAPEEIQRLTDWTRRNWDTPPALAITLQNPRLDDEEARHRRTVEEIRTAFEKVDNGVLVDVFAAFGRTDDPASFLEDDRLHPNDAGQALWADTVAGTLALNEIEPE